MSSSEVEEKIHCCRQYNDRSLLRSTQGSLSHKRNKRSVRGSPSSPMDSRHRSSNPVEVSTLCNNWNRRLCCWIQCTLCNTSDSHRTSKFSDSLQSLKDSLFCMLSHLAEESSLCCKQCTLWRKDPCKPSKLRCIWCTYSLGCLPRSRKGM